MQHMVIINLSVSSYLPIYLTSSLMLLCTTLTIGRRQTNCFNTHSLKWRPHLVPCHILSNSSTLYSYGAVIYFLCKYFFNRLNRLINNHYYLICLCIIISLFESGTLYSCLLYHSLTHNHSNMHKHTQHPSFSILLFCYCTRQVILLCVHNHSQKINN